MSRIVFLVFCSVSLCSVSLLQGQTGAAEEKPLANVPAIPAREEQTRVIESARENALRYTQSLPDFLCTQTVSRYSGLESSHSKLVDTLEISVGYTSKGEQYKLDKIDGIRTSKPLSAVGGVRSHGEFGTMLRDLFSAESAAVFEWARWTNLNGRRTHVYTFSISQSNSTYRINWVTDKKKQYHMTAAYTGEVFVDDASHQVMRITTKAEGIPQDWPVRGSFGLLEYGFFDIGGTQFLLPSRVEANVVLKSGGQRNISEFGHYRKFTGDASIKF